MEFVGAILTGLAGSAAPAATGAVAAGSTVATILSGGATALSILYGLSSANEQAVSLESAAADAETEIASEDIQGLQRRTSLKVALLESLGDMDTAYAASGIDVSFGTPAAARKAAVADADRALSIDNATTMQRGSRLTERARQYRLQARSRRGAGLMSGIVKGLDFAASAAARG